MTRLEILDASIRKLKFEIDVKSREGLMGMLEMAVPNETVLESTSSRKKNVESGASQGGIEAKRAVKA